VFKKRDFRDFKGPSGSTVSFIEEINQSRFVTTINLGPDLQSSYLEICPKIIVRSIASLILNYCNYVLSFSYDNPATNFIIQ